MSWSSQAGQDEWVHSIIGDSGYFVDVGAHDGVTHSNTYALEQLGWTGVCVEPNDDVFLELVNRRSAACLCYPISDEFKRRPFDGIAIGQGNNRICYPLKNALAVVQAPPIIDYLSIDVEGHELEVLAGMDFDRWHVRLITIEHNLYLRGPEHKEQIRAVLEPLGFKIDRENVIAPSYGEYEDWYVNRSLTK